MPDELLIYGEIGASPPLGVNSQTVAEFIAGRTGDIQIRINSGGGSLDEGNAIFSLLSDYSEGRVVGVIDGLCGSAATLPAMACDEVRMAANALLMIHLPSIEMSGEARDLREGADLLDKLGNLMADVYSRRTGLPRSRIDSMLAAETYMDAEEALALGFVDSISRPSAIAATVHQVLGRSETMAKQAKANEQTPIREEEVVTETTTTYMEEEETEEMTAEEETEQPAAAASFRALVRACAGYDRNDRQDRDFIVGLQEKGATAAQATAAWAKELKRRVTAAKKSTRHVVAMTEEPVESMEEEEAEASEETSCNAQARFSDEVAKLVARGVKRPEAVKRVSRANAELRFAALAAANPGKNLRHHPTFARSQSFKHAKGAR